MLYMIIDTFELARRNERAHEQSAGITDGFSEDQLVYFFDAEFFLNCIEKYYDTRDSKIILVDHAGACKSFLPQQRKDAILALQRDAERAFLPEEQPPFSQAERSSAVTLRASEHVSVLESFLLKGMGRIGSAGVFGDKVVICTPLVTQALAELGLSPHVDVWTWRDAPYRQLPEDSVIDVGNLLFNTGHLLPCLSPAKKKPPATSVVLTPLENTARLLRALAEKVCGTQKTIHCVRDPARETAEPLFVVPSDKGVSGTAEMRELDAHLKEKGVLADVRLWRDCSLLQPSASSSSEADAQAAEGQAIPRQRAYSYETRRGPRATRKLQKSTSEGDEGVWKAPQADEPRWRRPPGQARSLRQQSESPPKTTRAKGHGVWGRPSPRQDVSIVTREEIDRYMSNEGFRRISKKKRSGARGQQNRCRLKLYCGRQKAGVNCGYYHPPDELFKLHNEQGLTPCKIYLCRNDPCRFSAEPEKCSYAHSVQELFCTFCEKHGHHYSDCPEAASC